jgi:hypothetical protein
VESLDGKFELFALGKGRLLLLLVLTLMQLYIIYIPSLTLNLQATTLDLTLRSRR